MAKLDGGCDSDAWLEQLHAEEHASMQWFKPQWKQIFKWWDRFNDRAVLTR